MRNIAAFASVVVAFGLVSNAHAVPITFVASLNGPSEFPPNSSPGTGTATATYDDVLRTLTLDVAFSGLQGLTTVAHIHAPAVGVTLVAGVAVTPGTLPGFPAGVTAGAYSTVLDLSDSAVYQPGFLTASGGTTAGAEASLIASMMGVNGYAYFNIHTSLFPAGEIRGFFAVVPEPVAVPEPGALSLLLVGLLGLLAAGHGAGRRSMK